MEYGHTKCLQSIPSDIRHEQSERLETSLPAPGCLVWSWAQVTDCVEFLVFFLCPCGLCSVYYLPWHDGSRIGNSKSPQVWIRVQMCAWAKCPTFNWCLIQGAFLPHALHFQDPLQPWLGENGENNDWTSECQGCVWSVGAYQCGQLKLLLRKWKGNIKSLLCCAKYTKCLCK